LPDRKELPEIMPSLTAEPLRRASWKWWVCGLLLLATMLNYMDRLTLNYTAQHIRQEFGLNHEDYGQIESVFAVAFAVGAALLGWLVDRWNVWWVYPAAVLAWSGAGLSTGFAESFNALLLCRFCLGITEAGHWPCALRTTQRIVPAAQRNLGNGILQSGAAIGAIVTPLVTWSFLHWTGSWRYPFMVIGGLGLGWTLLWLALVQRRDLALPAAAGADSPRGRGESLGEVLRDHRFWLLVVVVVSINLTWHYFRVWLPSFLQEAHGFTDGEMSGFMIVYYLAADAGSLSAGFAALWLARRGLSVHHSRVVVFALAALLTSLTLLAPGLEGAPLLVVLLLVAFGSLALFPNYYSFSQELTVRHQGKVTGLLGCLNWLAMAPLHRLVGWSIDVEHSYSSALALIGLAPGLGLLALLCWGKRAEGKDSGGVNPASGAESARR
jgi:ACS family hexuronate transporter-like MFS transporter